eukprot:Em0025g115a
MNAVDVRVDKEVNADREVYAVYLEEKGAEPLPWVSGVGVESGDIIGVDGINYEVDAGLKHFCFVTKCNEALHCEMESEATPKEKKAMTVSEEVAGNHVFTSVPCRTTKRRQDLWSSEDFIFPAPKFGLRFGIN